jgi:hypothetical protein
LLYYQYKKDLYASHSLILLDLNAIQFDRIQEFLDNVDNKDYFPAETLAHKPTEPKENKGNVIINQPIIVREKNLGREGISVRDLLRK